MYHNVTRRKLSSALLKGDRANLYDVKNKEWVRTIPSWTGVTSANGRWLASDWLILGLDLLDMRLDGEVVRTFLPRTALGIFTVKAMFTQVMLASHWSKIVYINRILASDGLNHIHHDNNIFSFVLSDR